MDIMKIDIQKSNIIYFASIFKFITCIL